MGRAAKNETLKLNATFYNNLAVGVLVAGFLVPYIQIGSSGHLYVAKILTWSFNQEELLKATTALWGMGLSVFASLALRSVARAIIRRVEGD